MATPQFIKVNHAEEITTPFDGDLWNRKALADRLEQFIEPLNIGMTIALDAEWGAGKTWFVKHWMKQLKDNKFKVLYLDAFAQDYVEDPFVSISMEIAKCLEEEKGDTKKLVESIGDIYRAALPSLPMILWAITTTLMGAGALAKPFADVIERLQNDSGDAGKEVGTLLNDKLKEHLSAQVENYDNEKQSLQFFKNELIRLTKDLPKPLVFVIDELDRCKPEFAIRLIERIKHFFDVPNIVFVLSVNKTQLEQSINSSYGFSGDANYLEKFIDITVHLRKKESSAETYSHILKTYGKTIGVNMDFPSYHLACKVFKVNARQLIRILNKFAFLKAGFINGRSDLLFLILIFVELKLIEQFDEPSFFRYFIDAHEADIYMLEEALNIPITENNTLELLLPYYTHFGMLFKYLNETVHSRYKPIVSKYKRGYFPVDESKSNPDLIESWYNYIHIVED
ncbi:KAP family P-loop NTPase fold protein [Acinetobacter junii]|uniref:KAP family P-loop NTPase fold protein n=1 Tax=Acinetobacter junii TaxID=40215 RepID=UPI003214E3E4